MIRSERKYQAVPLMQRFVVDPPVRLVWRLGLAPPGDAELETTGRRTGRPRRTPICNGQVDGTFWLIAQHGRRSDYVRNIEADPRVRVRTGAHRAWRTGVARALPERVPRDEHRPADDPHRPRATRPGRRLTSRACPLSRRRSSAPGRGPGAS